MAIATSSREQAIQMTSSAALEAFWCVIAVGAALIGVSGTAPLTMSAIAAIGLAFALLAQSGLMATRWPAGTATDDEAPPAEAVGINISGSLAVLASATLALVGIWPMMLAPLALVILAGFLVLDAPIERAFIAPRGVIAAAVMALAGIVAIVTLAAAYSVRDANHSLVAQAALCIAGAQLVGALAVLFRSVRGITSS
jgi:hypothetical protein